MTDKGMTAKGMAGDDCHRNSVMPANGSGRADSENAQHPEPASHYRTPFTSNSEIAMRQSIATFLLVPALLAVAWLVTAASALPAAHSLATTAILLFGGALVAGFIASMQGMRKRALARGQPRIGIAVAGLFRLGVGLPVIAYMLYWAMRAAVLV